MITCPSCQHQELPGELYCSECGAQLFSSDPFGTQSIQKTPSDYFNIQVSFDPSSLALGEFEDDGDSRITLRVVDDNELVHVNGKNEFTVGRIAEGQPILPDVDLTPYQAYTLGVSRLHATFKMNEQRVLIMDLGSSNGTRVNGQKIVPHVDYPINLGDIIALGKLKLQVISHHMKQD